MKKKSKKIEIPHKNGSDTTHSIVKAGISLVPVFGGAASEIFNSLIVPPIEMRRNEWMEEISSILEALENKYDVKTSSLSDDPEFIDIVFQATRVALKTSNKEKRINLRNMILNSAIKTEKENAYQEIFIRLLDEMTAAHMSFLKMIDSAREWHTTLSSGFINSGTGSPLEEDSLLYKIVWKDFVNLGLIESDQPFPDGEKKLIKCKVTELGSRFISFIKLPNE
ncbi:MAG: hypothetical protein H8E17_11920 [Deltaproteobacteria bacterium]|nr:hypothetical protein [Deltaproteobacteria bacterium]